MTQSASACGRHAPEHADGLKEGTRCRGCQDRRLPSRVGDDRETRAAPLGRTDFDAVPEQFGCVLHDEEPEAETVRPAVIGSLKRPEDRRQRAGADADTGIAHRDAQFRAAAAARWRRPVSSKHGEQRGRRGRASSSCAATDLACLRVAQGLLRRRSARGAVAGLCINPSRSRSSRFDRRENAP